ncbi:MAG: hypothetical protein JO356_02575 [Acidobacteria bacterium]|nr:hypothetical protein [Acidobacteriota bacterium]
MRMALGASRGNVHLLICRQGYTAVCAGLAIGLGLTMVLLRVLREAVPGLEEENAASLTVSLIVVSLAAALACWLPARRAATIDPVVALREE